MINFFATTLCCIFLASTPLKANTVQTTPNTYKTEFSKAVIESGGNAEDILTWEIHDEGLLISSYINGKICSFNSPVTITTAYNTWLNILNQSPESNDLFASARSSDILKLIEELDQNQPISPEWLVNSKKQVIAIGRVQGIFENITNILGNRAFTIEQLSHSIYDHLSWRNLPDEESLSLDQTSFMDLLQQIYIYSLMHHFKIENIIYYPLDLENPSVNLYKTEFFTGVAASNMDSDEILVWEIHRDYSLISSLEEEGIYAHRLPITSNTFLETWLATLSPSPNDSAHTSSFDISAGDMVKISAKLTSMYPPTPRWLYHSQKQVIALDYQGAIFEDIVNTLGKNTFTAEEILYLCFKLCFEKAASGENIDYKTLVKLVEKMYISSTMCTFNIKSITYCPIKE